MQLQEQMEGQSAELSNCAAYVNQALSSLYQTLPWKFSYLEMEILLLCCENAVDHMGPVQIAEKYQNCEGCMSN